MNLFINILSQVIYYNIEIVDPLSGDRSVGGVQWQVPGGQDRTLGPIQVTIKRWVFLYRAFRRSFQKLALGTWNVTSPAGEKPKLVHKAKRILDWFWCTDRMRSSAMRKELRVEPLLF